MRIQLIFGAAIMTATIATCSALAISAIGQDKSVAERVKQADRPDARAMWQWLEDAEYENWATYPGTSAEFYEGTHPHGAHLKLFVNRPAAAHPKDPPHGSVIIKENYTPERELAAITIMARVDGYDSDNRDWYWVKYEANGEVAKKGEMELAGKVGSCIDCHASAHGGDYIFANDP